MGKTLINVQCTDQTLTITNAPIVASGGINEDEIEFNFCNKWDGFAKTAIFYRDKENVYNALITSDKCTIPKEVLTTEGNLFFGVFGVSGNVTRTSEVLRYKVKLGALTEGSAPPEPTPDIYAQILSAYGELDTRISEIEGSQGDMKKSVYDTDSDGIVDNAEKLGGKLPSAYANASHTHTIANVTGLQSALNGKQATGNYLTSETDPTVPAWAKAASKPSYATSEISGLQSALNGKAASGHTHALSDSSITDVLPISKGGTGVNNAFDGIEALLTTGFVSDGSMINANNITRTSVYQVGISGSGVPAANNYPDSYGILVAIKGGSYVMQFYMNIVDGTIFSRKRNDLNVWSVWKTVTQT